MMIPKNSRNRRKQLSNHDSNDSTTTSSSKKISAGKALPTITRTSNHTSSHTKSNHTSTHHSSDRYSNSLHGDDSNCSWVELDFNQTEHGKNTTSKSRSNHSKLDKGNNKKPVSTVNIDMDLVDDEESKSSTTSNLSEDFTDKGDIPKAIDNKDDKNDDESDASVTSFGSDSFANDVPFDDLLNESLMPSCSDLGAEMRKEALDELSEMGNKTSQPPLSFRSEAGTKPSSERSSKPMSERSKMSSTSANNKKQQSTKKHSSPKSKPSRKKSKSPGVIQARKRLSQNKSSNNDESTTADDAAHKEHKKRVSPKGSKSITSSSPRRREGQVAPPPPPGPPPTEEEAASVDQGSSHKKKSKPSKSPGVPLRRRRLRSSDAQDDTSTGIMEDETKEPVIKDGNKEERRRTKSKTKHRKTPGRSISNPDAAAAAAAKRELRKRYKKRSSSGHESDDDFSSIIENLNTGPSKSRSSSGQKKRTSSGHESDDDMSNAITSENLNETPKTRSSIQKKRTSSSHESDDDINIIASENPNTNAKSRSSSRGRKKKTSSGHESEDEMSNIITTENLNGTSKSRSTSRGRREGKKKIRSKSTEDKRLSRNSDGRRRRKKRHSKTSEDNVAGEPGEDSPKVLESPTPAAPPAPDAEDEDEDIDPKLKPEAGPMEIMTYSFHCQSSDDDKEKDESENWLNSANSSSSSLSYNSFAQFSLDVGEISGLVTDIPPLMADGALGELIASGSVGNASGHNTSGHRSIGIVPDLDASVQSFQSNFSGGLDASVVFMAGKSSKVSLLANHQSHHSFDNGDDFEDGLVNTGRSARSVPTGSSDGFSGQKQLRRRLKKTDGGNKIKDRSMINSEIKKKVRRAKSGGLERVKDSLLAGAAASEGNSRGGVGRSRSHSGADELVSGTSKLVMSSAKKQERQEKATRRKKEKPSSSSSSNKPKHAGKSKSAHTREPSTSPKNKSPKNKINREKLAIKGDLFKSDLFDGSEVEYKERAILLNDAATFEEHPSPNPSTFRSPKRSPRGRHVNRTFSNPCPSPSIHVVGSHSAHEFAGDSPMSYASSPSYTEASKRSRKPSPSRQALLSSSVDDDSDESDANYSPHSGKQKRSSFLPKRGLDRTPSALLAGVRNHFKENSGNKMLSKMKKTFSVSGRGGSSFDFDDISIGMTTEKGYVSTKERRRMMAESAGRRGQVKNSLYACMSDSDSSVDISSEIFRDSESDDEGGGSRGKSKGSSSVASYKSDHHERAGPRRVHSLPIGIRKTPHA